MPKKRSHILPLLSTRVTATASVAMVMFILGVAAFLGLAAHRASEGIRSNMGFTVMFIEDIQASDIDAVSSLLKGRRAVASAVYSSPQAVLDRWQAMVGDEEDILNLAGVNPFVGELEVKLHPGYANPDSIDALTAPLMLMPQVADVKVHTDMMGRIDSTLRSVGVVLTVVAVILLIVSFVLIFNTVRLAVYARRFTIHTMKLVGATSAYVRRPFLLRNLADGFIAGILATIALAALALYGHTLSGGDASLVPDWGEVMMVGAGVTIAGMIVSLTGALFATNRYLRLSYDELFR